jgi:hypothetical protein
MSGAYFVITTLLILGIVLSSTSRRRENPKGWARLFMQRSPAKPDSSRNRVES